MTIDPNITHDLTNMDSGQSSARRYNTCSPWRLSPL